MQLCSQAAEELITRYGGPANLWTMRTLVLASFVLLVLIHHFVFLQYVQEMHLLSFLFCLGAYCSPSSDPNTYILTPMFFTEQI